MSSSLALDLRLRTAAYLFLLFFSSSHLSSPPSSSSPPLLPTPYPLALLGRKQSNAPRGRAIVRRELRKIRVLQRTPPSSAHPPRLLPPSNPAVTPSVLPDPLPILLDDPLSILLSFDTPPSTTPSLGDLYSILFPPQPSGPVSLPGPLNPPFGMPTALEPTYIGKRDNSMCCMPTIVEPTSIGKRDNSMCCMPTPLEPTSIGKRDNPLCCMTTPLEPTSIGKRDNSMCCMPTPLEPTDIGTSLSPSQSGNPPSSKPTAPAPTSSDTSVSQSQSGAAGGSEKPGSAKGLNVPLVTLLGAVGFGMLL
ncbi:hypothetical protein MVEN_01155100 [Mycena venus]|uniref:Uncharacterized protein n=1 Tax=Mycena venus TaxID=2733690 RepID=A0A8H6Y3D7_9AGAR|nr:hypothetical protein MVEN_01155100 [Mycena venus]